MSSKSVLLLGSCANELSVDRFDAYSAKHSKKQFL